MKMSELCGLPMDETKAYLLGLCFPLFRETKFKDKRVILGCVNHNKASDELISIHYSRLFDLLKENGFHERIQILENKTLGIKKKGFTVVIESDDNAQKLMDEVVSNLVNENKNIREHFIKGCFDGRSSYDKTLMCLSVDVDRDETKQDLIYGVGLSLGFGFNLNRRAKDHEKNDQVRVRRTDLKKFLNNIGFLSEIRAEKLRSVI